MSRTQKLHC
uniref:Uncharacterized protein n=1 Tax=Anguilla anguilla TaxID=7936 RepID=A0A0E9XBR5_ANGAN